VQIRDQSYVYSPDVGQGYESMRLFSRFRKGNKPEKIANELGPFLVQVAVHECETFQNVWQRKLDDHSQVALFAEVVIILVTVADRLAFDKLGDPVRAQIMNPVVDTIRDSFANQSYFGETTQDRISFFEQLFSNRIHMYSPVQASWVKDKIQSFLLELATLLRFFLMTFRRLSFQWLSLKPERL
jgi:hypothetical protein